MDGAHLCGVHNPDAVGISARDVESAVLSEEHVVGVGPNCDRANHAIGCEVDYADGVAGPVGDEKGLTVGAHEEFIRVHFYRDFAGHFACGRVEDGDVAGEVASTAIGGVKNWLGGMMQEARPIGFVHRPRAPQFGSGLGGNFAIGVIEDIDGGDAGIAARNGVATGSEETLAVGRPGEAKPGGLQRDALGRFFGCGIEDDQSVGIEAGMQGDDGLAVG